MKRTMLLARMKEGLHRSQTFPLTSRSGVAIRLRRRNPLAISSLPADSNTRVSMLLTAKADTDSFDTTDTLLAALR